MPNILLGILPPSPPLSILLIGMKCKEIINISFLALKRCKVKLQTIKNKCSY